MATDICPHCGFGNPSNMKFCQKCGTALVVKCRRCGTVNPFGVEFCGNCGTKLSEARFALSQTSVTKWRKIFGGLDGWSPVFTPSTNCLETWASLTPPLDPHAEPLIFDVRITGRLLSEKHRAFKVFEVKIRGETFTLNKIYDITDLLSTKDAYLLATNSRLVAYVPDKRRAQQVLYEEIKTLSVQKDYFILTLDDGSVADLHMYIERLGLLATIAVIGAPLEAKPYALGLEQSKQRGAVTFIEAFTAFFMEIIEENRQLEPRNTTLSVGLPSTDELNTANHLTKEEFAKLNVLQKHVVKKLGYLLDEKEAIAVGWMLGHSLEEEARKVSQERGKRVTYSE